MTTEPTLDAAGPLCAAVVNWAALGLHAPANRHGNSLRVWARFDDGLRLQGLAYADLSETAWLLRSDEPRRNGGADSAPSPGALLETGLVAAYMNEILAAAEIHEILVHGMELTLDSYYLLPAGDARLTVQALPLELEIRIASSVTGDELRDALLFALRTAPQHGLLRQSRPPLLRPAAAETPAFDSAAVRLGPSLLGEPLVSPLAGGSASADASEPAAVDGAVRLQGRSRCRLREDGIKEIEHAWVSWPDATRFRLLADEPEGFGGRGLAPDAATYMATGLALSLATELGRQARAAGMDLADAAWRADAHFPFGGLVEAGVTRADMDPVEAAATLSSAEDTQVADLLQRGARTSLAQALCADRLATNIRIRPL